MTCGSCPQGTSCDTNTGICRQFRPPDDGSSFTRCSNVNCAYGQQCDQNTGRCVTFRDPSRNPSQSRCSYIQCPTGYQCDWNYGICRNFRDPNVKSCENILCPQGTTCDSNTGICRQFRPPSFARRSITNYCQMAKCPNNFSCDPTDGVCKIKKRQVPQPEDSAQIFYAQTVPSHPPFPSIAWQRPTGDFCPPNSVYTECGSRCPYTCTELHPRCANDQQNCIGTCQCNNGYVQASRVNVTCVPARECGEISEFGNI